MNIMDCTHVLNTGKIQRETNIATVKQVQNKQARKESHKQNKKIKQRPANRKTDRINIAT